MSVRLNLSQSRFFPADSFDLDAHLTNPGPAAWAEQPLAVALDLLGVFYFYPQWTTGFQTAPISMPPGELAIELLRFDWPGGVGHGGPAVIYGAMLTRDLSGILGQWDSVEFDWEE